MSLTRDGFFRLSCFQLNDVKHPTSEGGHVRFRRVHPGEWAERFQVVQQGIGKARKDSQPLDATYETYKCTWNEVKK